MNPNDTPKIWQDPDTMVEDVEADTEIVEYEEKKLSYDEQMEIAKSVPEDYQSLFGALVEVASMGKALTALNTQESQEARRTMIDLTAEAFIKKRMETNVRLEDIKIELINRVAENIDKIDVVTAFEMSSKIHEITAVDAQRPLGSYSNPSIGLPQQTPGVVVNVASGDNAGITSNTLNVNQQPPIQDLKSVSKIVEVSKAWGNVPTKQNPVVVDVTPDDKPTP